MEFDSAVSGRIKKKTGGVWRSFGLFLSLLISQDRGGEMP